MAPSLLLHPSAAVREAAVRFVAAAASVLPPPDVYARLLPLVQLALVAEPVSLGTPEAIVELLKGPSPAAAVVPSKPAAPAVLAPGRNNAVMLCDLSMQP